PGWCAHPSAGTTRRWSCVARSGAGVAAPRTPGRRRRARSRRPRPPTAPRPAGRCAAIRAARYRTFSCPASFRPRSRGSRRRAAHGTEVAAARSAGEKDLAAAIGKLRRPTRAAWLVNQLARRYPDSIVALFDLGEQLGAAQRELRGRDLRTLSTRLQQHLDDLVARIRGIDPDAREPLPAEVRATLTAAVSGPDLAAPVRPGRLTATTTYSGFGPLTAVPPPDRTPARPPSPGRRPPPVR